MIEDVENQFNSDILAPGMKTLELHHIAVKDDSYRRIGHDTELREGEKRYCCRLVDEPFILRHGESTYQFPRRYKAYEDIPFTKITNADELENAIHETQNESKYIRWFTDEELFGEMRMILSPIEGSFSMRQEGMLYRLNFGGKYAVLNDTMVYINRRGDCPYFSLGNAVRID